MGLKVKHIDVGAALARDEWEAEATHEFVDEDLGHLADVNVPTPGDKYFLSYDSATGLWIARDLYGLLTTQGDVIQRGASDWGRLAIGSRRFFPRVNEAGNALEYVKGYQFGKAIHPWQWELDFYEWSTTVTGTGSVYAKRYGEFGIQTGTTAGSTGRGIGYRWVWFNYGVDFEWFATVVMRSHSTNGKTWLKIDDDVSGDPTLKAIGWRIDDLALKGIVHNGSSLDVVDLSTTINLHMNYALFINFIAGDKIEWYVGGVLKGSSENIPSAYRETYVFPVLNVENGADEANTRADIWRHGWIHSLE